MKICPKCKLLKFQESFGKNKSTKDGLNRRCKLCVNTETTIRLKNDPEKVKSINAKKRESRKKYYASERGIICKRRAHLKSMYGISFEKYEEMLKSQNSKCAICGNENTHTRQQYLNVDHCHTTGNIRELLCFKCNNALGCVNDNIDILKKLIEYLEKHKT